jgi:phosphoglycolate phosphatase
MSYKHVIWDWNGTLLDDVDIGVKILNYMQKKRDIAETSLKEYRRIFTFPVEKYYERAGLMDTGLSFKELAEDYIEQYNIAVETIVLYKDAKKVLEKLNACGISQSILTAGPEELVSGQLKAFDISKYFVALTGKTDHYASGKEELAEVHMEKLGVDASDMIFVGDTMHDVEVAQRIGCDYLLVSHGHQDIEYLAQGEIATANDLNDVVSFIDTK